MRLMKIAKLINGTNKKVLVTGFVFWGFLLCLSQSVSAAIPVYDESELRGRNSLYQNFLVGLFEQDLKGQLPLHDKPYAAGIKLELPRKITGNLLAVGAHIPSKTIYFPMETMAFLDDLSALAGWLAKHDCSFEPAALYAGMIANKKRPAGSNLYPNPRDAFGIGDNVWQDTFVKSTSNQVLKTAVYFILAHEVAHILYEHAPYESVTHSHAQKQELEADLYALKVMRHIGVPPLGMFHFFTVLSRVENVIPTTHPLSGARLMQIVTTLENYPEDFVPPNESASYWSPIIYAYANKFKSIVPVIDNPVLRDSLTEHAKAAKWSDLQKYCD